MFPIPQLSTPTNGATIFQFVILGIVLCHSDFPEVVAVLSGRPVLQIRGGNPQAESDNLDIPSRWVEVQGLNIHYKCFGKGAPVILIHGSGNDWHEWQENFAYLAEGFHVYALDMPGFGMSQPLDTPLSLPWSVSFPANFMDMMGIPRAHLIGHSLGGIVALAFALDSPTRLLKLVLIDSAGLGELDIKAHLLLLIIRGVRRLTTKEQCPRFAYTPGTRRLLLNRLQDLRPSIMLVWGQHDPYLPVSQAELAHLLIPDSTLCIFPDCGHAPQRERSEEFNSLICQFLSNDGNQGNENASIPSELKQLNCSRSSFRTWGAAVM